MPSARRHRSARLASSVVCGLLLAGSLGTLTGCTTTQDTAAAKQAESKRILKRRERKRERRQHEKQKGGDER